MGIGEPRRRLDFGKARAGAGIGDIVGQATVEQHGFLRHDGDLAAQAGLGGGGNILAINRQPSAGRFVQPLDELDEGRLARSRAPDQPDTLAGRDDEIEAVEQRPCGALIAETDLFKRDPPGQDRQRRRLDAVGDAERFGVEQDEFLKLVNTALELVHMLADIAQIAMDDEIGSDDIGDIAGARLALGPKPQRCAGDGDAHAPQQRQQPHRGGDMAPPRARHPPLPFRQHRAQDRIFAGFAGKGLDDGIAADRIGENAADAGVPLVRKPRRWRNPARRQHDGKADIGDRAHRHHCAEQRCPGAEQHH